MWLSERSLQPEIMDDYTPRRRLSMRSSGSWV